MPSAALQPTTAPSGMLAPSPGYVQQLVANHERLVGIRVKTARDTGTSRTQLAGGRSLDDITRAIRTYRKLLGDPRIPAAYKKTTQVVRAGQAIFADICLRLPAVLAAKPMVIKADPLDDEKDSQEAATKKEEWTSAMILGQEGRRAILDNGKSSIWRDWMDNLVNVGRGAFLLQVREDRWAESAPGFPTTDDYDDDTEETPASRRRTKGEKYRDAVDRYKREHSPLVLESVDPLSVHIVEDEDGIEDEAILVVKRPYRDTLARYGLKPIENKTVNDIDGIEGQYIPGPEGFGRPYPVYEFDSPVVEPEYVQTVTYYCSARRARYLGLIRADNTNDDGKPVDKDSGVWSHYVDGICVDGGYLPGPHWHPLPMFRAFGLSTAMADPTYQGIPAPMHLIELIAVLDQIITMEMHIAYWSAFPMLVEEDKGSGGTLATGLPDDTLNNPARAQQPGVDQSKESRTIEPGQYRKMGPGRTIRWMPLPAEATIHLERLYGHAREITDLIGLPSVFRGQGGSGQAGYAIAMLNVAARSLYDPVVENGTATVAQAVKYAWWQLWKRFPEGIPTFYEGNENRSGHTPGLKVLMPQDIAPDGKGAGKGTPFLACSVNADPLLPQDEGQNELRGINANAAGMIDKLTAREKYFGDPAPERTESRIFADKIMESRWTISVETFRALVRSGRLVPKLGIYGLAAELQIDPQLAYEQLMARDAFTSEQIIALQQEQQAVQQQMQMMQAEQQAQQMAMQGGMGMNGGMGAGQAMQPTFNGQLGGQMSVPGVPQPSMPMGPSLGPTTPQAPNVSTIGPGANLRAGVAANQPSAERRAASALSN